MSGRRSLEHAEELQEAGVDGEWAMKASAMMYGYSLLDVVDLTEIAERDREPREPSEVAALYYGLSEHLGIDLALTSVSALERGDRWHALARLALRDDLYGSLRAITLDAPARSGARHAAAGGHRAVGAGQRVAAGAGAGGVARGEHGRAVRSRHPLGGLRQLRGLAR